MVTAVNLTCVPLSLCLLCIPVCLCGFLAVWLYTHAFLHLHAVYLHPLIGRLVFQLQCWNTLQASPRVLANHSFFSPLLHHHSHGQSVCCLPALQPQPLLSTRSCHSSTQQIQAFFTHPLAQSVIALPYNKSSISTPESVSAFGSP